MLNFLYSTLLQRVIGIVICIFILTPTYSWAENSQIKTITGHYQCKNIIRGYVRHLAIKLNPNVPPLNDRFFVFQLLFTGDSKQITGQSKGHMLYDMDKNIAVDYVENQQNKKIKGPGLMYFQFSGAKNVSFSTFFFEPSLNKIGEYHCKKSLEIIKQQSIE
ncbi:hypothetical protein [uncultured Shewanella sp.]|uniref:hypothetical protein n=1 Tax=uncultured Shewanella sp. TaxID=173975 RepID=UPI0026154784|nr:hypothetical protein [uncultured Shewanella sp.]